MMKQHSVYAQVSCSEKIPRLLSGETGRRMSAIGMLYNALMHAGVTVRLQNFRLFGSIGSEIFPLGTPRRLEFDDP